MRELYRFENLWFQCYFPTLVFKFGSKLLEKERMATGNYNRIMLVLYVVYLVVILADFLYVSIVDLQACKGTAPPIQKFLT